MSKYKSNYADKVRGSVVAKKEAKKSFGYLNLPEGVKAFTIKNETRTIKVDLLPYIVTDENHPDKNVKEGYAIKGEPWWIRQFSVHHQIGEKNETVVCPTSIGKKCPICEYIYKSIKGGTDWKTFSEISAKKRSLYVVVPIDSDEHKETIHIWDMSDHLFYIVLDEHIRENLISDKFMSLEVGKTLELRLKWKEFHNNAFPEVVYIKDLNREPYDESILEKTPSLDNVLKVLSYEELQEKFMAGVVSEETGDLKELDETDVSEYRRSAGTSVKEEEPVRLQRSKEKETTKEEEPPRRRRALEEEKPTVEKVETNNKCPHGHKFGEDFESFKDCDTCVKYDDCFDANRKIQAK